MMNSEDNPKFWEDIYKNNDNLVFEYANGLGGFTVEDHFSDPNKSIELFEFETSDYSILVRNSELPINDPSFGEIIVGTSKNDNLNGYSGYRTAWDEFYGYHGDDTIDNRSGGSSWIEGGSGDDYIYGGDFSDTIYGDTLYASSVHYAPGNDVLLGGSGNDTIVGGGGDDIISGGSGDDILTGGAGVDTFKFLVGSGTDIITDFEDGIDILDYSGNATIGSAVDGSKMYTFSDNSQITLTGVPASNSNHHSFTSGGNNFILVSSARSYDEASQYASSIGGTLATFNSSEKFEGFYNAVSTTIESQGLNPNVATDGGGAQYVWLGATDQVNEGEWVWDNGVDMSFSNWGSGALGVEPDNFDNQDGLALGLENWPIGSSISLGYGDAGYWNDVDLSNPLFFIVEIS
mgnify:FL=1